jgi:hypothetical protein
MVRSSKPFSARVQKDLTEIELLTRMIREHQEQIEKIGLRRRKILVRLHQLKDHPKNPEIVRYEDMAEAMGVGKQAVYKAIFETPELRAARAAAKQNATKATTSDD